MIISVILISGLMATAAMTLFMNACAAVTRRNMYTVSILRQMLAIVMQDKNGTIPTSAGFIAATAHYAIGIFFTFFYYLLRSSQGYIGFNNSAEPWIMGIVFGLIGVSGWIIFIRQHPSPLLSVPWWLYLCCIFAGHLVFTFVMICSFNWWGIIFNSP